MDVILDNTKIINIDSLEAGIYVWRIEENEIIFSNKILVQ